jgi:dGTPase
MATFGCFFVTGLLREAGWPRPQGLLRKEVIDTMILDSAIDQMIDWSAAIGAGRPRLGLQVIAEMFAFFIKSPRELPASYQEKTRIEPLHRIVCDYIAGMTDSYILEQHRRFCPPKKRVGV